MHGQAPPKRRSSDFADGAAVAVSIVMPCLNERDSLPHCIANAKQALALIAKSHALDGEVVIADNGSTDGSQDLARSLGARVVDVAAKGYGAALIGGFREARGRYLVMGDADGSYDFTDAVAMIGRLEQGADLCMGSRFKGGIKPGAMPWKNRYIGNPVLSGLLRLLFRTHISDSHCGLRALTRDAFERLSLSSTGMEFASEMVLKAVLRGLKIAEVPVTLSPDQRDRPPHLSPWRDGMRHLIYMLLLSPTWLFLLPAGLLFVFGLTILGALTVVGDAHSVQLGDVALGNHWAVVSSAAMIVAVQTGTIGIFALQYGYREKFRTPTPLARALLRISRLQYWVLAGAVLIAIGVTWTGMITEGWIASGFGALAEMRSLIAAATLAVIGNQIFFSGFLMSIVSGNRSRHDAFLA